MDDQFQKVEDEYFRLKGQLQGGRIMREQFETALKDLMIQDAQGRWWMLGVNDAKWYTNDGKSWVEATPPAGAVSSTASATSLQGRSGAANIVVASRAGASPTSSRKLPYAIGVGIAGASLGLSILCIILAAVSSGRLVPFGMVVLLPIFVISLVAAVVFLIALTRA